MRAIREVRREDQRARRRARRDQPRRHPGGDAARLLLRARPVEPAGLLDRRQRRGELRRRALPEVRLHHQPRARRRARHRRRRAPSSSAERPRTAPGYDLLGAVVGSEGTLGIVTSATVRLVRLPEEVRTILVGFESTDQAGAAVSAIIAAGIAAGRDRDDGRARDRGRRGGRALQLPRRRRRGAGHRARRRRGRGRAEEYAEVERLCREAGAFEQRLATDPADRALIWKGRKSAFAAVGRISPDYIVQDGVIPRTALPEVLKAIADLSSTSGVRVANVFHAGDGNLHPLVLFDDAVEGAGEAAEEVSGAILDLCIEHGGSITGEHGVGMDKAKYMPRMYTDEDLDTMQLVRCAFDPSSISNPGKVFPTPAAVRRGARPAQGRPPAAGGRPGGGLLMSTLTSTHRPRGARLRLRGRPRRAARRRRRRRPARPGGPARRHRPGRRGAAGGGRARPHRRAPRARHQADLGHRRPRARTCCST